MIGQWHHYSQKAQKHQITAIESAAGIGKTRYFDGVDDEGSKKISAESRVPEPDRRQYR